MGAGNRDRQIVIERPAQTTDGAGQPIRAFEVFCKPWAEVVAPQPGSDSFAAGQTAPRRSLSFRILYRPGLASSMVVVFDGERYEIEDVVEENRRHTLLLKCFGVTVVTGG
jgi:SPP1 family predicted phage head-tail adaptor